MTEYYDLLPELNIDFEDLFKPELEQILLFYEGDKIMLRLVFSELAGIQSNDKDLSFVVDNSGPLFKTDYTLETNAMQFLSLDNLSLLIVIGEAFTKEGLEKMSVG